MKIESLIGINNIVFGSTKDEIESIIGIPSSTKIDEWPDKSNSETWVYSDLELELAFDQEDDYKLGTITTTSKNAALEGIKPISLNIKAVINHLLTVELDEDFGDNVKNYIYPEKEISFWVVNDIVENISLFPEYDETGEIPIWPKKLTSDCGVNPNKK